MEVRVWVWVRVRVWVRGIIHQSAASFSSIHWQRGLTTRADSARGIARSRQRPEWGTQVGEKSARGGVAR